MSLSLLGPNPYALHMLKFGLRLMILCGVVFATTQCVPPARVGKPNMGGPTVEVREAKILQEPVGDFYYGRRYYVEKTRFWGYLRKPRQPWTRAQLVMMKEDKVNVPDRLPETGPKGERYGYDQNHEYRIHGYYTGGTAYDPNSNQVLPVFMLTDYKLLDRDPGWLFRPTDHFHPKRITLRPR